MGKTEGESFRGAQITEVLWLAYMWSQFRYHRTQLKVTIHDRDLTMWTMDKAFKVGIPNFKTSSHFIQNFKNEHKVTSCRKRIY